MSPRLERSETPGSISESLIFVLAGRVGDRSRDKPGPSILTHHLMAMEKFPIQTCYRSPRLTCRPSAVVIVGFSPSSQAVKMPCLASIITGT